MKWFKHDSDASIDAKLKKVRLKYGMEGYGVYWFCLEMIARGVERHNLTFELEHDAEIIADDTGIHPEVISEMMAYMCNLNLFESNLDGKITCLKMATRTDEYTAKLIKTKGVVPTLSGQSPDTIGTKSVLIEEKRREEKIPVKKQKTKKTFPPTIQDVRSYVKERGYTDIDPDKFLAHYESSGWMRGKTKITDWKACIRTWRNNNKSGSRKANNYNVGAI